MEVYQQQRCLRDLVALAAPEVVRRALVEVDLLAEDLRAEIEMSTGHEIQKGAL